MDQVSTDTPKSYPRLYLRFIAMFWDSFFLSMWIFLVIYLSTLLDFQSRWSHGLFIGFLLFSFEPLLTYFFGGTLGHTRFGIRVSNRIPGKKLAIWQCYARLAFKVVLGFYSLMAIVATSKRQALHDIMSNSMVVFIDESKAPLRHKVSQKDSERYVQVSIFRRILVIVAYIALLFCCQIGLLFFALSQSCGAGDYCTTGDNIIWIAISICGWPGQIAVLFYGLSGRLVGARRRER